MTYDINFIVLSCLNLKIGEEQKRQKYILLALACSIKFFSFNKLLNKDFFLIPRNKYLTPCAEVICCKKIVLDKLLVAP